MKDSQLILFIKINYHKLTFSIGDHDHEFNDFKIQYKLDIQLTAQNDNRFFDFEEIFILIKKNIYLIEKKFNFTFKETVLILGNFNSSFVNISGYKKLNGSQILRENVTYILNTLKSYIDKNELKKTILHIFNSNFLLDYKNINNLPIGLFGDFYSHELSFSLINKNDFKNIKNIFDRCNLKLKKILLNSFIHGALISEKFEKVETFFKLEINHERSSIFLFENNALKYEQVFNFGNDIIINDISKITLLKKENIKDILESNEFKNEFLNDDLLEEKFFKGEKSRKLKKKLIYEIALARINEIIDLIIFNNINLKHFSNSSKILFLSLNYDINTCILSEIYKNVLSKSKFLEVRYLDTVSEQNLLSTANKIVHFGWKKEAIPVTQPKKSLIARFFEAIFD